MCGFLLRGNNAEGGGGSHDTRTLTSFALLRRDVRARAMLIAPCRRKCELAMWSDLLERCVSHVYICRSFNLSNEFHKISSPLRRAETVHLGHFLLRDCTATKKHPGWQRRVALEQTCKSDEENLIYLASLSAILQTNPMHAQCANIVCDRRRHASE